MKYARVTFLIEADDPSHSTGVTNETFEAVNDGVLNLSVEVLDVDIARAEDKDDDR